MALLAARITAASSLAFGRRLWAEWRALLFGVVLASLTLTVAFAHRWSEWSREASRLSQQQAEEIRTLRGELRTARSELRIVQTQNDLLATRRLLALARRSLELQRADDAQEQLAQASSYLRAVNPMTIDVNAARLERVKGEMMVADLRHEKDVWHADRRLCELAGEVDALLGE